MTRHVRALITGIVVLTCIGVGVAGTSWLLDHSPTLGVALMFLSLAYLVGLLWRD